MFFLANPKDQEQLVSRRFYLDKLSEFARQGKNIAILGPKKSGKTSLIRDIIKTLEKDSEILPVYIGLSRTSTPPENFSIELVGGASFWFLGAFSQYKKAKDWRKFQTIEHLAAIKDSIIKDKLGRNAADIVEILHAELQKIKPDQKLMLQKAFSFAEEISKFLKKKVVIILDDFENVFDLNNFSQVRNALSLVNFKSKNVHYIFATSYKTLLQESLGENRKEFVFEEIFGLTSDETEKLAEKICGPKMDKKIVDQILDYSHGIPILVKAISSRYKETKDVRKAFLVELVHKNSLSYHYLDSVLNEFLYSARGEAMPKTVVKVLAFMKDARLTEIAKKLYRSAPVTKSLLERIMLVDMIIKVDNKYHFANPVLKQWLRLVFSGFEFDEIPSDEILKEAEEVLDEQQ